MKTNRLSLFWGILLIGSGIAFAVLQQTNYFDRLPDSVWMWVFAFVSFAALVTYLVSGWKQWGWLFPFGVFGGLAVTVALAVNNVDSAAVGSPLFVGLLIPFAAADLQDRAKNWWALIPGGVMLFLALVTLLVDNVGGEWVGAAFLFLIALSFFIVYLGNRTRMWALLVTYILFVLSIAPALASFSGNAVAYFGSIVLLAVALPFFVVYFRYADKNWWAIIPAGVTTTLAIVATLGTAGWIRDELTGSYTGAIFLGGLAATFAVVWLRHAKDWAKIVAVVLAVLAVASVFFASYNELFWPLAFILGGGYLLYTALRPKHA